MEVGIDAQTPFFTYQIQWAQPSFPQYNGLSVWLISECPIIGGVRVPIAYSTWEVGHMLSRKPRSSPTRQKFLPDHTPYIVLQATPFA